MVPPTITVGRLVQCLVQRTLVVLLIKFCIVITNTGLLIVGWLNTYRGISWARIGGLN